MGKEGGGVPVNGAAPGSRKARKMLKMVPENPGNGLFFDFFHVWGKNN